MFIFECYPDSISKIVSFQLQIQQSPSHTYMRSICPHSQHSPSPSFKSNQSQVTNTHHFSNNPLPVKNYEYFESSHDGKQRSHTPSTDQEIQNHQRESKHSRINIYGSQMEINFMKISSMHNFMEEIQKRSDLIMQTKIAVQLVVIQKGIAINPNLQNMLIGIRQRYQESQMEKIFN